MHDLINNQIKTVLNIPFSNIHGENSNAYDAIIQHKLANINPIWKSLTHHCRILSWKTVSRMALVLSQSRCYRYPGPIPLRMTATRAREKAHLNHARRHLERRLACEPLHFPTLRVGSASGERLFSVWSFAAVVVVWLLCWNGGQNLEAKWEKWKGENDAKRRRENIMTDWILYTYPTYFVDTRSFLVLDFIITVAITLCSTQIFVTFYVILISAQFPVISFRGIISFWRITRESESVIIILVWTEILLLVIVGKFVAAI